MKLIQIGLYLLSFFFLTLFGAAYAMHPVIITGKIILETNITAFPSVGTHPGFGFQLSPTSGSQSYAMTQVNMPEVYSSNRDASVVGGFSVIMNPGETATECLRDQNQQWGLSSACLCQFTIHVSQAGQVSFSDIRAHEDSQMKLVAQMYFDDPSTPVLKISSVNE